MSTLMRALPLVVFLVVIVVIFSPPVADAQQGGWLLYVDHSWKNYTVESGQKGAYGDDLNHGCWGNYGNQFPTGIDPTSQRWGWIDADGKITGGCRILEKYGASSMSILGTISGTFDVKSQTSGTIHLETTESSTITVGGKLEITTHTTFVDGAITPSDDSYQTHQIKGTYKSTFEGVGVLQLPEPKKISGSVTIPLSIAGMTKSAVDLKIEPDDNDIARTFVYHPYSFRIKLQRKRADGTYEPMVGETVKLPPDLWNQQYTPVFARGFQTSNCTNCGVQYIDGVAVSYTRSVSDPILLKTDAKGEATIRFYLDMARLEEFKLAPTRNKPLTTSFRVTYEPKGEVIAKAETTVKLNGVGIIEKIAYTAPTLFDPASNGMRELPQSRRTSELVQFTRQNGDRCSDDNPALCGAERVRITHENAVWFGGPESGAQLGETLKPGDLVVGGDEIRINVCNLPQRNRIIGGNPAGGPAEITVQIRFFDGLRGKFIVNETVRESGYDFYFDPQGVLKTHATLWSFCGSRMLVAPFTNSDNKSLWKRVKEMLGLPLDTNKAANWVVGKVMDTVVETTFPAYAELSGAAGKVSTAIGFVKTILGNKAVYEQVNSAIYLESRGNSFASTTRKGAPVIFTPATGAQGIAVPPGQTAIIPESLVPQLQPTDPETARRADELLSQMRSESAPGAPLQPSGTANAGGGNLYLFLGLGLVGVAALAVTFVAVIALRRRSTRAVPSHPPETRSPLAPSSHPGAPMSPDRRAGSVPPPADLPERPPTRAATPSRPTDLPE